MMVRPARRPPSTSKAGSSVDHHDPAPGEFRPRGLEHGRLGLAEGDRPGLGRGLDGGEERADGRPQAVGHREPWRPGCDAYSRAPPWTACEAVRRSE
jgi:hypothetical protein